METEFNNQIIREFTKRYDSQLKNHFWDLFGQLLSTTINEKNSAMLTL